MNKYKNYIKYSIITILVLLVSILLTLRISNNRLNISDIKTFNIWLFLLIVIGICFIISHFIFKPKKVYDFIYNKRFIIALIILIILVLGKFNGSSIGLWDTYIEPNITTQETLIGENRAIRSDEWLVNTPYAVSQQYNDYKYYNKMPRATKTDMFSTIFTPVKDVLILSRPFNIGYLLMGEEYGLSFYWYGRLIALILVTFEFLMLITNKNKLLSLVGAILLAGSPLVSWFYSNYIVDLLISGQLCLLFFNAYLETKNNKLKILYSILIAFAFTWFALTFYPAWQVPLGYMYLVFAIWIFVKNFKNNKSIKDYLYLLITVFLIGFMIYRYLSLGLDTLKIVMSTVYPGSRDEIGGYGFVTNFAYPITIFFPFFHYNNPCEGARVYSLFPLPIIISIIYLIKSKLNNKKEKNYINLLLLLLTILAILFTIYTIVPIPSIIAKLTLLNKCPAPRIVQICGIVCLYLLILTINKIKINNNKISIVLLFISIVSSYIIVKMGYLYLTDGFSYKKLLVATIVLSIIMYLYLNSSKKYNYYLLSILLMVLGLTNIIFVNPVNIGTNVLHKTETAKEISKIIKKDKSANWISIDSIVLGNYIIVNGGEAINATNIYPNLKLWHKIDKKGKYEDIYNRYAHIIINLTDEETSFELIQGDLFKLELNYNDLDKLDVEYIISGKELELNDEYKEKIKKIYHNDNIWIYNYSK